ncbi:hypothetical protein Nepgr_023481 [Nepenthes gracilis]|uniref:Glycosyl hydrolase family 13 catalytic domain-containing protein n=1 Tax=Nepenthes gracilis TaxID=150966 RepID=A0AAD3T2X5_NEPGR|nr:hypothetical protein Nepgr_023481 [Nepenthes gracilis]
MERSDYASFGYHVTNFFAMSSRFGTPEDFKSLIDKAHSFGLRVLMDVIHSHTDNNIIDDLNGFDVGHPSFIRLCSWMPASSSLNIMFRVIAISIEKAGSPLKLQFESNDADSKTIGSISPLEMSTILWACWMMSRSSRILKLFKEKENNLADCFSQFFWLRLRRRWHGTVKTCESHLQTRGRAWAVSLSQRSNFSEEILRISFNCNVNMAEVDLLYGSSLHGKGLHRFWSRIEGYHGQASQDSHFHTGDRGYHKLWDSRLFNYANWEVLRFLLSNLRWGLEEFRFEGFRFIIMESTQHSWGPTTAVAAVVYLMMARSLIIHNILRDATVIAEDVSGTPRFCHSVSEGGIGFDYCLAMTIPNLWITCLKIDFPREGNKWSYGKCRRQWHLGKY